METNAIGSPNTNRIRNANEDRMLVQPMSQVISNSNHDAIAPEISCLATQIPNTITTSILGDQGQLGVGVHAAQGSQAVSKKNLPFYAPTIVEGKPIVHVQSNQFFHLPNRFENLIIGRFVGRKLPFGFVRETFTRTWKLKENFILKTYGETMFSFQFKSEEDRKIDVENEEKETDKDEQTRSEVIKSLDKGDDMQTNVKGAGEFGVEKLGSKEVWEKQNKNHTTRALTVADCRNKGVTILTGREHEGTPMNETRQVTIEQIKGKGIEIQADCQGEG
ncbi:hypothetical protein FRX31_035441 [Thalictrum thalictroides]|uniref:DUF4283 domain-containing protein n=1 Tax=Thalictrum thalictroides TaxID=46969 RepID=A0A7J6URT7_THATH|nr:hypothetical protein FRX31_035441 [Thalictrum thalictroides]